MLQERKQFLIEWGFVALLVALCAILTLLQYRWTGEVSRAEADKLRIGVTEDAQRFCAAFDATLLEYTTALLPRGETLNDQNRESVHKQLFQKWKSANPRPIFSHLAVAVPSGNGTELFEIAADGALSPTAWPPEWHALQQSFSNNGPPGPHPFKNPSGTLKEFPIFGGNSDHGDPPPERGRPGESEWMIFELDTNYLRNTWLPELAEQYLSSAGQAINDVVVREVSSLGTVIYASRAEAVKNPETPVRMRFNYQGRDPENLRGPGPENRWSLEVRPRPGALDSILSASRRRNLAVAIGLNGLILAAGLALIFHTWRSRQLAEAQMNFVANVSHELRTPLTVIRGAAHNLTRGVVHKPGQIKQYAGLIIQHAEQLGDMVEQVLALAGAQKKHSAALRQPVALVEVLHDAVAATANDTQAAQCEVHLELPPVLLVVIGDASAFRRVFQNLITNAAKHGGNGKWIGITAVNDEDSESPMVEIQVADRGPGIPMSEQLEIFKPFFRGAQTQALQIRGSGLGLSLVKEIVESHGGTVSVRGTNGHGATFIVRLPAAKQEN